MKFGSVDSVKGIDLSLPKDHPSTKQVLGGKPAKKISVAVGCAKWNRTDLKNFYPRGTKDELEYYSTQFNSIELNATFYGRFNKAQYARWKSKVPQGFLFFPKVPQSISHLRRLANVKGLVEEFCDSASALEEHLGMAFLQMHDNFKPKDFSRLETFVKDWPKSVPLAIELRNNEWFASKEVFDDVCELFSKHRITNIIVDTAGRRDIIHMRLTTPYAFVRYVGANDPSDYTRLDPWVERIAHWKKEGLQKLFFFVHQNHELESPLLSSYFIEKLNKKLELDLKIPELIGTAHATEKKSPAKAAAKKTRKTPAKKSAGNLFG